MTHTDPSDLLTRLKLDRQQHQGFPLCSPTPFPRLFAAHILMRALNSLHFSGFVIESTYEDQRRAFIAADGSRGSAAEGSQCRSEWDASC